MTTLTFIIYILATYRISRFLIEDELFSPVRDRIWSKFPPSTKLGYLFTCYWCISIYSATLLTLSYILIPSVMFYIALALALSAATGIISKLLDR